MTTNDTRPRITAVSDDKLAQYLTERRTQRPTGLDAIGGDLVPGPGYDTYIAGILSLAAFGDDAEQRRSALARCAYQWGFVAVKIRTGNPPSPAVAVYCGGTRLAAYFAGHAVAEYCRNHRSTAGDEQLQELIAAMNTRLGRNPGEEPDDEWMLELGTRLRRYITQLGYVREPELQGLLMLSRVGTTDGAERAAAIGHLVRRVVTPSCELDSTLVRDAVRTAPLPGKANTFAEGSDVGPTE